MKTKTLLSIAIIAALPFAANATQTIVETNTPAAVGENGTVNRAATAAPYQTATIGEHDDEHIATTAYVKGAYNDTIAAVNNLGANLDALSINTVEDLAGKQDELVIYDNGSPISNQVITLGTIDSEADGIVHDLIVNSGGEMQTVVAMAQDTELQFVHAIDSDAGDALVSFGAVMSLIGAAGLELKSGTDAVDTKLDSKRVDIYTTWDTNNTTQVQLSNVRTQ